MKTVKTRDSATTILRKIGVNNRDYGLFIKRLEDGRFEVDDAAARKKTAGEVINYLVATKDVELKPAPATEAKPVKEKRHTISSLAEELLLAGKSNPEVWTAIKERFKPGDDKKHYPSWFRSRLRRQGKLPKREKKS